MNRFSGLLEPAKLRIWLLCEVPLLAVLILTAAMDPAAGFEPGNGKFLFYVPVAALTVLFSLLLDWIKGFFVLHFAGVRCSFTDSAALLGRIHCFMALIEALFTLLLFFCRQYGFYRILSQVQLFGHELVYAFLFRLWLREKSEAGFKRCLVISMICFLASSAWLLLSVIASI